MENMNFLLQLVSVVLGLSAGLFVQEAMSESLREELVVCLMGDPQLYLESETGGNVAKAMQDLTTLPHEFLAVLGDLVQNRAHLYKDYREAVLDKAVRPVFSLAGNADVGAGLDAYQEATGFPLYYSFHRRGIRFIFLSTIYYSGVHYHICHLGREQIQWLRKELESDTTSTTVIFSHPPIFETTWRSEERDHLEAPGSMYLGESLELRELFRLHPNVTIYAHGHLHHSYDATDQFGRGTYFKEGDLLHISVGSTANNRGTSFLFIERDKITVKVRDHGRQAWRDEHEYQLNCATTLQDEHGNPDSVWSVIRKGISEKSESSN